MMKSEEESTDDVSKELLHKLHIEYLANYSSNPKYAMVCITF